ncbi:MAG TPA: D-alanyl-D-alanine carboxypeptidase family protein [Roseomonas sp.]
MTDSTARPGRSFSFYRALGLFGVWLLAAALPDVAQAQIGSDRYSAIVQDARTGATLMAANADEPRHPASLTKMMTLYMLFEAIRDGRAALDTPIMMSREAASQPPSRLGLPAGNSLTAEQAILALVTKSANDVAFALGEFLGGGDEDRFAQMMTLRARSLGMTRTTFRNASGLPDPDQVTTARDIVLLGRRLREDFPAYYHYFSTDSFRFRGQVIPSHNRLLAEYEGTDGIKTGYVNDSGFNLVTSVERDGQRLIGAVFGGATSRERDRHMMAILDQSFARLGVAPREPMVASRGLGIVGAARADTLPRRRYVYVEEEREPVVRRGRSSIRQARVVVTRDAARARPARSHAVVPAARRVVATRTALGGHGGHRLAAPQPNRQVAARRGSRGEQGDREDRAPSRRRVAAR